MDKVNLSHIPSNHHPIVALVRRDPRSHHTHHAAFKLTRLKGSISQAEYVRYSVRAERSKPR